MPNVAAVRLTYNPRVLWFDPNGIEFSAGDALIVKTERGLEYGVADENLKEVSEDAIAKLKSPLKPVMRKATSEDSAKWANLQAQAEEALPVFKEMVEQYKLDHASRDPLESFSMATKRFSTSRQTSVSISANSCVRWLLNSMFESTCVKLACATKRASSAASDTAGRSCAALAWAASSIRCQFVWRKTRICR